MPSPEREEYCEKLADALYKAVTLIDFMSYEYLIPKEIAKELKDTIEDIAHKAGCGPQYLRLTRGIR